MYFWYNLNYQTEYYSRLSETLEKINKIQFAWTELLRKGTLEFDRDNEDCVLLAAEEKGIKNEIKKSKTKWKKTDKSNIPPELGDLPVKTALNSFDKRIKNSDNGPVHQYLIALKKSMDVKYKQKIMLELDAKLVIYANDLRLKMIDSVGDEERVKNAYMEFIALKMLVNHVDSIQQAAGHDSILYGTTQLIELTSIFTQAVEKRYRF